MTRINPITDKAQLPPEQQHEWDAIAAERGRVRGPFGVMLHSPGLSMGFLSSVHHAHGNGVVSDALHELAILAVAYEDDAPFQWSTHITSARAAGLREAAIEAARTGGDLSGLDDDERDVIELCRQLCRTNRVEQALFDSLWQARRAVGDHGGRDRRPLPLRRRLQQRLRDRRVEGDDQLPVRRAFGGGA